MIVTLRSSTNGSSASELGQVVMFISESATTRIFVTLGSTRQLCTMNPLSAGQGGLASGLTAQKAAARQASAQRVGFRGSRRGSTQHSTARRSAARREH